MTKAQRASIAKLVWMLRRGYPVGWLMNHAIEVVEQECLGKKRRAKKVKAA
jgi:hypothetical protein